MFSYALYSRNVVCVMQLFDFLLFVLVCITKLKMVLSRHKDFLLGQVSIMQEALYPQLGCEIKKQNYLCRFIYLFNFFI